MDIWHKIAELFSTPIVSDIFAGLAGGVVALRFEKEEITIRKSLAIIFFGVVSSIYLGGLIVDFFSLSERSGNGVRFICGLASIKLFEAILFMADGIRKNPVGFIKNILGNGTNTKK